MVNKKISFSSKKLVPFLIYLLVYCAFFILNLPEIVSYSVIYISASLVFILLCIYILKINLPLKFIYFLIAASILLRGLISFTEPTGSDDYYRYLWDGKVIANGINPYKYAPADEELSHLHSDLLPAKVKMGDIKTVYPPLSLLIFYFAYLISGETPAGIKILLFLFELLTLYGIFLILKKLQLPLKNILIYAFAPLPVFQFFIDAHVDGFGLTLLIFSIYFYLSEKKNLSLIFLGLSICIKPLTIIVIPILFFIEKRIQVKIKAILIPLFICILLYLPFIFTANVFDALTKFTVNWTFNGIIFEILNSFINNNQHSRLICGILFAISFLAVLFSKKDFLIKIYLSVFLLLIFSPIVHPWYVSWLAVLLPFIPRWSGILFSALISLAVLTELNYQLYGVWKNYPLILVLEYTPVLVLFLYELFKEKRIPVNNFSE